MCLSFSHERAFTSHYCLAAKFIDFSAFAGSLLESVLIPESFKSLRAYAFAQTNLKKVVIPESMLHIYDYPFYGTQMTDVMIPTSVTYLGDNAFGGNLSLSKVSLPDRTQLHSYAFARIFDLQRIEYCGKAIPILRETPVCPPDCRTLLDSMKVAAKLKDKQEADAKVTADLKAKVRPLLRLH
jgi:hypothetical protein